MLPQIADIIKHHIRNRAYLKTHIQLFTQLDHPRKYLDLEAMAYALCAEDDGVLYIMTVLLIGFAAVEVAWKALAAFSFIFHEQILLGLNYLLKKGVYLWRDVLLVDEVEANDEVGDPGVGASCYLLNMIQHQIHVFLAIPLMTRNDHLELEIRVFC